MSRNTTFQILRTNATNPSGTLSDGELLFNKQTGKLMIGTANNQDIGNAFVINPDEVQIDSADMQMLSVTSRANISGLQVYNTATFQGTVTVQGTANLSFADAQNLRAGTVVVDSTISASVINATTVNATTVVANSLSATSISTTGTFKVSKLEVRDTDDPEVKVFDACSNLYANIKYNSGQMRLTYGINGGSPQNIANLNDITTELRNYVLATDNSINATRLDYMKLNSVTYDMKPVKFISGKIKPDADDDVQYDAGSIVYFTSSNRMFIKVANTGVFTSDFVEITVNTSWT